MTEPQLLEVLKKANDHYNVIYVGIGKLKFGTRHDVLKITALGSCVGLAIYPERFKGEPIGALAHIMLPSSRTRTTENNIGKAKYADTAIEHILKKYYELGYKPNELQAKATGGGNMYPKRLPQRQLDIGNQNIQEIKRLLKQHQIPLKNAVFGGTESRSMTYIIEKKLIIVTDTGRKNPQIL